jgi:prepilin peptidase CpaA
MLFDHFPLLSHAWLLALTATAAVTDTRSGLIPNWLTLPTLALAPLAQLAAGGVADALNALGAVLACALVPLLLFALRAMGGGDVKLFGALGALCGASLGLGLQLVSYALAAVVGLAVATRRGRLSTAHATPVRLGAPVFCAALALGTRTALAAS